MLIKQPRFLTFDTAPYQAEPAIVPLAYDPATHSLIAYAGGTGSGGGSPGTGGGGGTGEPFATVEPAPNGTQTTFVIPHFVAGTTRVYLNGLRQRRGNGRDYVESVSATQITFFEAPHASDWICVDYQPYIEESQE